MSSFWTYQLAKPKVVPPEKKVDALLRKRIQKDKAKDQLVKLDHRVENLRNDLVLAQSQAEERQRVLVLQSDPTSLYDKVDPVALCHHTLSNTPDDRIVGAMESLADKFASLRELMVRHAQSR